MQAAEIENARRLARDAILYGTNFVDVTGRRIDPTTVLISPAKVDGKEAGAG